MNLSEEIREQIVEYKRPWKLLALCVGVILLIVGSFYYRAPDWDISISLIMAFFTYLTASWSMRVLLERQWRRFPLMLLFTWFTVDGCYWLYWSIEDPSALLMRDVNFLASLSLYAMCGLIWYHKGTLRQLVAEAKALVTGSSANGA